MTSFIALNIVTVVAGSRMIYAMGRDRLLPAWFDHVNGRGAPDRAIVAIAVVFLAITEILGSIYSPGALASWPHTSRRLVEAGQLFAQSTPEESEVLTSHTTREPV